MAEHVSSCDVLISFAKFWGDKRYILDDSFYRSEFFNHFLMMTSTLKWILGSYVLWHLFELVVRFPKMSFFHPFDVRFNKSYIENILLSRPFYVGIPYFPNFPFLLTVNWVIRMLFRHLNWSMRNLCIWNHLFSVYSYYNTVL